MRTLRVGVSVCFEAANSNRSLFTGKALQYVERSLVAWVSSSGALPVLVPATPENERIEEYSHCLDALVLHGGADLSPQSYGQHPLRPEWCGDRARDLYEIALTKAFLAVDKPILAVCRGMQLLNVALGGTLIQDLPSQLGERVRHRDSMLYDQNFHPIEVTRDSWMSSANQRHSRVNSIHHQAIDRLADGLAVHALSPDDGIVEAVALKDASFAVGVQWHPEFHDRNDSSLLSDAPLLGRFIESAMARIDPPR
ncbi:gamma-glutamyl-gamma-aminobutyrate hydrolase family protein [Steroidobacter sp.]|uniref:gamma-glutamyl-gamma-aminobutyrate hydrolase family protein n=1 Tax=Steroidobacter sp. TaxID=1978227 RepID=UPI001A591008|nr:type 1 glutamine amidotransferase [Steroidobacter sp.]MBL8265967.1 type 1 glutamine amidotransferase [Steroidobacter sp.]